MLNNFITLEKLGAWFLYNCILIAACAVWIFVNVKILGNDIVLGTDAPSSFVKHH